VGVRNAIRAIGICGSDDVMKLIDADTQPWRLQQTAAGVVPDRQTVAHARLCGQNGGAVYG